MSKCELSEKCIFFNEMMSNMPSTTKLTKKQYCLKNKSRCARYIVFSPLGREKVPIDLFPHQKEYAETIINESKND